MDELVKAIIARVPVWSQAREIRAERIEGLTNANYRVTVDGESFVLRISGENTERLGINRDHEVAAIRSAAAAGLAPDLVETILPERHLVTRWVNGCHWKADEFRTPDHVRLLTETVKRIHALPPGGATFSPFRRVETFLEAARCTGVTLPDGLDGCIGTMGMVEAEQQADPSDWRRFCHNDLVSVNYLYDDESELITVLDWEFSGMGDVYYDLATVVYTHDNVGPIPTELEEIMLACYFGKVTNQQRRRLTGMKYMLMLFTGMWGLAQHGMVLTGVIPPVDGFDYLEFSNYLFTHDIRERRMDFEKSL